MMLVARRLAGKFGEKFALIRATKKTYLQLDEELIVSTTSICRDCMHFGDTAVR